MKVKRIIAAALSVCMLGGAVGYDSPLFEGASVTADAAKQKYENVSGTCGESLTWTLDRNTGVLTVEGTGEMTESPWSEYKEQIKKVVLPEGLTNICDEAFRGGSSLTEINIPDSVTSIGSSAFESCSSLTDIHIPEGITSISSSTFYECSSLTEINIPDSVISIGGNAFSGCSSLTEINIPEGVTAIENYAFRGCSSLTSITLPSTCEDIGSSAMRACPNLESVTILNPDVYFEPFVYRLGEVYDPSPVYYTNVHWDISENEIETWRNQDLGGSGVSNEPVFSGTVYGYPDSTAEEFAKDYCNFVALDSPSVSKGDLNNDKLIDGRDATLVLAMYADSSSSGYVPTDADRAVGDVNSDTFIDGRDATIILGYYADLSAGASISFENYLKSMNYV